MPLMVLLIASVVALSIDGPRQKPAKDLVQEGQKLLRDGDVEQALARFKDAVAAAPDLFDAQYGAGRAFDLVGDYRDARAHLERAITLAPDDARDQALSAMGISYAFEARADDAARYYQRVFDAQIQADDRPNASATANAIGRIYLESGNLRKAEEWYRTGYETGKKVSQQPAAAMALVEMRWRNAMGRLAARRGDRKAALAHAREAMTTSSRSTRTCWGTSRSIRATTVAPSRSSRKGIRTTHSSSGSPLRRTKSWETR